MLQSLPGGQCFNPKFFVPKLVTLMGDTIKVKMVDLEDQTETISIKVHPDESVVSQINRIRGRINEIYQNLEESSEEPEIEQLGPQFSFLCSADTSADESEAEAELLRTLEAEEAAEFGVDILDSGNVG